MKFTLILGMPRSGTSVVASMIEKMGMDFCISKDNTLDGVYAIDHIFNQRRDIHFFIAGLGVDNMETCKSRIPLDLFINNKSRVIKEPYLLFILNQIREFVLNIVLVIRNPNEVIESTKTFLKNNGDDRNPKLESWNKYHKIFIESVGDIPYIVVDYNKMIENSENTVKKLGDFLNINIIQNMVYKDRKCKCNLVLPINTMYIYKTLLLGILPKLVFGNTSPNTKCFCESGKKYKKCCGRI